jgi:hypothetical protein
MLSYCSGLTTQPQVIMSEINVTAVLTPKPEKFEEVSLALYFLTVQISNLSCCPPGSCSGNRSHQTGARARTGHTTLLRMWNQGQEWDCNRWEVSQPSRYRYRSAVSPGLTDISPAWRGRASAQSTSQEHLCHNFQDSDQLDNIDIKTQRRSRPTLNRPISEPSQGNYPLCWRSRRRSGQVGSWVVRGAYRAFRWFSFGF